MRNQHIYWFANKKLSSNINSYSTSRKKSVSFFLMDEIKEIQKERFTEGKYKQTLDVHCIMYSIYQLPLPFSPISSSDADTVITVVP